MRKKAFETEEEFIDRFTAKFGYKGEIQEHQKRTNFVEQLMTKLELSKQDGAHFTNMPSHLAKKFKLPRFKWNFVVAVVKILSKQSQDFFRIPPTKLNRTWISLVDGGSYYG